MSFSDIKGHSVQIRSLLENLRNNRLASAYLFSGPEAIGKKMTALNFAKFINCPVRNDVPPNGGTISNGVNQALDDSCGECPSCKKIDSLQHPDVFLITSEAEKDAETSLLGKKEASRAIKIEQVKEMEKRSAFRPYEAKYKVFIIDQAENMTQEASDALLKTLEEPPKDTIFILVSANEKLLSATILSRCRRIKFNALALEEMKEILMECYHLDEKKAHFLSCFSQGRLALALEIKDKDILREKNSLIEDFIYKRIDFRDRHDAQYKLNLFLSWFRDLLLLKLKARPTLINIDKEAYLMKNKDSYSIPELKDCIGFIYKALFYLERNINLRLLTSLTRIKLCKT
ncbi:MAG: DNA polymerase III subunit delta' [Candidatus Omnitrophota bacterium]|nr:DNA polymerase III subunit delta' [Candidatus Omnitrophota bacterium]